MPVTLNYELVSIGTKKVLNVEIFNFIDVRVDKVFANYTL